MTCSTCKHWHGLAARKHPRRIDERGRAIRVAPCRRYPPDPGSSAGARWPETAGDDHCGEHDASPLRNPATGRPTGS